MFPARARLLLRQRGLERVDEHGPRPARLDHLVDVAALRRAVGIRKPFPVVLDQLLAARLRIVRVLELLAEDDVHRAVRAHHRDLCRRPREVEVRTDVLGAHDVVRAAVRLARDHRQLRHRRLRERVQQLRAVANDPAPLLLRTGEKSRHVDERDERNVERVAEPDEARGLHRRVDVQDAGKRARLVPDDPDRMAAQTREAAHDVLRPELVHLEKVAVVDDTRHDVVHVVRLVRIVGDERVELRLLPIARV